jgi:hypothetical protein
MFKLFRRNETPPKPQGKPAPQPAQARTRRSRPVPLVQEPPPLPEVREDHDESAWDLWEQSQFQLDSQMGELSPSDSVRVKQERPSEMGDLDPFSRIGKNDR